MHVFSIGEALEFGWRKTREHSELVFKIVLTFFALQVVTTIVQKVLAHTFIGVLASLALAGTSVVLSAGLTVILLKLARGHAARYRELVPPGAVVWRFFCASFLAALASAAGLLLFIIPGIYLFMRLSMVRFEAVEGAGITESLYKSMALTRGRVWHLLGFFLAVIGINILGACFFLIGLLVTIPVTLIAWARVYQQLKQAR
jgi:hypothetical protein